MKIVGLSTYLPQGRVDNQHFSAATGRAPEWFLRLTGITERRRAERGENAGVLATRAVAGLRATHAELLSQVDYIIGCSYTPWDTVGTLAHVVQREFELTKARAIYISSACSSVFNALEIARSLLESRCSKVILVVAAEHNSLYSRDSDDQSGHLWGDGAAAMLLANGTSTGACLDVVDVLTAGLGHLGQGPAGVCLTPAQHGLVMPHGKDVFAHAVREMGNTANALLTKAGLIPADLDLLVPHQANLRIIDGVAQRIGIDREKVATSISLLGNTGCASTLITLQQHRENLRPGSNVLLVAFGGGYSSGGALLRVAA